MGAQPGYLIKTLGYLEPKNRTKKQNKFVNFTTPLTISKLIGGKAAALRKAEKTVDKQLELEGNEEHQENLQQL